MQLWFDLRMCSYTGIGICITRRLFVHSFILGKNIVFGNRREIDKRYRRVYRARESTVRRSSYLTRETCRWGSEIGFNITRRPFIHSFILGKNMVFADRRAIKKDREEFIERERVQLEGRATQSGKLVDGNRESTSVSLGDLWAMHSSYVHPRKNVVFGDRREIEKREGRVRREREREKVQLEGRSTQSGKLVDDDGIYI